MRVVGFLDREIKLCFAHWDQKFTFKKIPFTHNYPESLVGIKRIINAVFRSNSNSKNSLDCNRENNNIDFTKNIVLPESSLYTEKIKYTLFNKFQINTTFRYSFKLNTIIKL